MKFSEIVDQLRPLLSDHYLGSNPEITAIAATLMLVGPLLEKMAIARPAGRAIK